MVHTVTNIVVIDSVVESIRGKKCSDNDPQVMSSGFIWVKPWGLS